MWVRHHTDACEHHLGWRVSTAKWQLGGVSGPGRKLRVCSMLKEVMVRLTGAGRTAAAEAEDDQRSA